MERVDGSQDDNFSISEQVYTLWRRKWSFLFATALVLTIGIAIIAKVPIVYRSTGVILIEQQEIPTQWVNSTVSSFAEERIQAISQRVLSTSNITKIIDTHNLFSHLKNTSNLDQVVERVRGNFTIETIEARIRDRVSGRGNEGTVAIQLSYDDASPKVAMEVATALVTLYLEENLKARTQAAVDTRRFLESEADRLELELAKLEGGISEFKETNLGALPEHQNINLQTYQRVEQQIADIDRTLGSLEERKVILETSIDSARRFLRAGRIVDTGTGAVVDPVRQRLEGLRSQYMSLQTRYSAYHPDLIRLRREIGLLESQILLGVGSPTNQTQLESLITQLQGAKNRYSDQHPEIVRLEREIAALGEAGSGDSEMTSGSSSAIANITPQEDTSLIALRTNLQSTISEQRSLRAHKSDLIKKLASLEVQINKTPEVEREYRSLIRDHENLQNKYNEIRAKQNSARVSESLEAEQKGERFTLLETPHIARTPYSPNHKKLFTLALGFALLGGLGTVFGLEMIDGRVRNIRSLESLTGVPVLATVGVIKNEKDHVYRKLKILLALVLIGLIVGGLLYIIYQYISGDLQPKQIQESIQEKLANNELSKDTWSSIREWFTNFNISRLIEWSKK